MRVIMLTTFEHDDYVLRALRAGASGFLLKGVEPSELLDAIRVVAAGDALLAPSVTRSLLERFSVLHEPGAALKGGSPNSHHANWRCSPSSARDSATLRSPSSSCSAPSTAKTHVNRVMMKLGVHDRAQLVIAAYEGGLVSPRANGPTSPATTNAVGEVTARADDRPPALRRLV